MKRNKLFKGNNGSTKEKEAEDRKWSVEIK